MRQIYLIVHNVRSAHNVGSMLRTADGLAVDKVYLSGYTPYPHRSGDQRLPHEAQHVHDKISKTALGAENSVDWEHAADVLNLVKSLKEEGVEVVALEQTVKSRSLPDFRPPQRIAVLVGSERGGLTEDIISVCNLSLQIPMLGRKDSYNVAVAAAMALFHVRFT